jgi:hypothetical protein
LIASAPAQETGLSVDQTRYESIPRDFRPVNDVMMPFRLNQKMNGRLIDEAYGRENGSKYAHG